MPWRSYDPTKVMDSYATVPNGGVTIPTTDEVAYTLPRNSMHKWAYNKLLVSEFQGIPCGICGTEPTEYPVIIKPIFNLNGGGTGACVAHNKEQYEQLQQAGYFWSRFQFGEHYSVDLILVDGDIKFTICFRGEKLQLGLFDYWETCILPHDLAMYVTAFINKHFTDYSGCINLEIIGNGITEVHLRMGDIDRLGDPALLTAIYDCYKYNTYSYYPAFSQFYIAALFGQPKTQFNINEKLLRACAPKLTYIQIDKSYDNNPPSGNRLAIFCGDNLEEVCEARNIAIALFDKEIHGKFTQPLHKFRDYR